MLAVLINHLTLMKLTAKTHNIVDFAIKVIIVALFLFGLLSCTPSLPYNGRKADYTDRKVKGYVYEVFLSDSVVRETNLRTGAVTITKYNY